MTRTLALSAAAVVLVFLVARLAGVDDDIVASALTGERDLVLWSAIAVGVLAVDVVVPVPSSVVMLAVGALLGPLVGTAVNVVGILAAALLGYGAGRLVVMHRRLSRLLNVDGGQAPTAHFSPWVIAATRGVPVVSESVAISAGAMRMRHRSFLLGAAAGAIPLALAYAAAGWSARGGELIGIAIAVGIVSAHGIAALTHMARRRWATGHEPSPH